jgi:tetratricopeptide (TPR) repeat protein/tRNA A-37 threonylcarbamoyl transferase component Bud32
MSTDATTRLSHSLRDRYRIERELGSGGMATVYLAQDLRHDRRVAVKVLRPDFAATLGSARFLDEIRIAAKLTHPHIMPVHDSGVADGLLYYVMPFSEGESLEERLEREGELPIETAVEIVEEVVDALGYAHGQGVVHRDVKPGNVLSHGGHVMIVDFGVAKALSEAMGRSDAEATAEGMAIGTPAYMAPEQAAADPSVDHRADLYSAGVLAYELLAGRPPFDGGPPQSILTRQITETPLPIRQLRPSVSPELGAWVMRSLEKRPADRWQSADEMLSALRAIGSVSVTAGSEPTPKDQRDAGFRRLWFAAAAMVAVVLFAAVWSNLRRPALDEEGRAVVGVFENLTGDPSLDPVGYMLQDWLTDGLQQSGLLEVVPTITARQAADYIGEERGNGRVRDPISALSDETGADIVISGSLYLDGDRLRIQTSVTDATDRDEVRLVGSIDPVSGPADNVTPLFDQVRERLLGSLATSLNRRLAAQVGLSERAPTYEAYEALNRGLDRYAAREYEAASELFLRAFELDDTYVVPLVYASLSLRNDNDWAGSDSVVTILEDRFDELSEYQRYWVVYSRAVLEGDLERARLTIRRAAMLSPQSKAAYNWALMAVYMGRPNEAREALALLDPDRGAMRGISRYWHRLIEAAHQSGEHEHELELVEELESRYPDERSLFRQKVWAFSALGWTENLKSVFAEAVGSGVPSDVIAVRYRNAATDLFIHGHEEAAREFARLGIEYIDSRTTTRGRESAFDPGAIPLRARQQLLYQRGRLFEIVGEPAEALAIYRELEEQRPEAWFFRAHSGVVLAQLGRISEAMDVDRWLETLDIPYDRGGVTTWRAGIAARLGDHERATALLDQAREEGTYWTEIHPVFHLYDAMGNYEPFVHSMAPRG